MAPGVKRPPVTDTELMSRLNACLVNSRFARTRSSDTSDSQNSGKERSKETVSSETHIIYTPSSEMCPLPRVWTPQGGLQKQTAGMQQLRLRPHPPRSRLQPAYTLRVVWRSSHILRPRPHHQARGLQTLFLRRKVGQGGFGCGQAEPLLTLMNSAASHDKGPRKKESPGPQESHKSHHPNTNSACCTCRPGTPSSCLLKSNSQFWLSVIPAVDRLASTSLQYTVMNLICLSMYLSVIQVTHHTVFSEIFIYLPNEQMKHFHI